MYLKLTTRCNMRCAHCCMSAQHIKGPVPLSRVKQTNKHYMTLEVFIAALELEGEGGRFCLGGGEPTIHPLFWQFLGLAMSYAGNEKIWLATNGKEEHTALVLARMAKAGIIACDLSLDKWHSEITPAVKQAFIKDPPKRIGDLRSIRTVTTPFPVGRAKKEVAAMHLADHSSCHCPEITVNPDGTIRQCGCSSSPVIGDVWHGYETEDSYTCYQRI